MSKFESEGFDLDALGNGDSGDVIFEIGGGATVIANNEEKPLQHQPTEPMKTPVEAAEALKQRGNEEFKKRNFLQAYDMYTEAIEACPCPIKVEEILRQREEFNEMEREKAQLRMEKEMSMQAFCLKYAKNSELSYQS